MRHHSREFKLQVVKQIASGEKRPAQVCREYDIANSLLVRWRHEYEERGEGAFTAKQASEAQAFQARIAELERFCGQLAMENAVLKKALNLQGQGARWRDDTL